MIHTLALIWAFGFLLIIVVGTILLLTRKGTLPAPGPLFNAVEAKLDADILRTSLTQALAQSQDDAEFEHTMRRLLQQSVTFDIDSQWANLVKRITDYQRSGEPHASRRVLAQRLLDDLPR